MAQAREIFAKGSVIGVIVLQMAPYVPNKNENFNDFSPAEIEAIRHAYRQILEGFSNSFVSKSEKREIARSVLEALGRIATREGVEKVLKLVRED